MSPTPRITEGLTSTFTMATGLTAGGRCRGAAALRRPLTLNVFRLGTYSETLKYSTALERAVEGKSIAGKLLLRIVEFVRHSGWLLGSPPSVDGLENIIDENFLVFLNVPAPRW